MHWIYNFSIPAIFDNCAESACTVCLEKKINVHFFCNILLERPTMKTHDLKTCFIKFSYFSQNCGYSSLINYQPMIFMENLKLERFWKKFDHFDICTERERFVITKLKKYICQICFHLPELTCNMINHQT